MAVKQGESVVSLIYNIQDILDLLRFRGTVLGRHGGRGRDLWPVTRGGEL